MRKFYITGLLIKLAYLLPVMVVSMIYGAIQILKQSDAEAMTRLMYSIEKGSKIEKTIVIVWFVVVAVAFYVGLDKLARW